MKVFHYPLGALAADYAGSAVGLACSAAPLAFVELAAPVAWLMAAAAALFLVYFARTVCRQFTRIELDETGIRARGRPCLPSGTAIRWADLCALRLDYFSTRRDREGGWMQLKLADGRRTLRIDSALEGFVEVALRSANEAARLELALEPSTVSNLQALRG